MHFIPRHRGGCWLTMLTCPYNEFLRIAAEQGLLGLALARKDTVSAVRIGKELLVQPVKVEGTKTLRMKGEVRKKLQILLQKAGKDESGKICIK